jgi:hypothetical protein
MRYQKGGRDSEIPEGRKRRKGGGRSEVSEARNGETQLRRASSCVRCLWSFIHVLVENQICFFCWISAAE